MSKEQKFKKRVREHAKKHGMSYQAALQQLHAQDSPETPMPEQPVPDPDEDAYGYLRYVLKDLRKLVLLATPTDFALTSRFDCIETALSKIEGARDQEHREVFKATAVFSTGPTTTLRVSKIGGHWHPLGEEASNRFRTANRVTLPDGTVIKDRETPVEVMVRCPFHEDDNASMRVLPDGHFFCFGCGATGTTTDLTKPHLFVRHPATLYKLPPPDDDKATEDADDALGRWAKYAESLERRINELKAAAEPFPPVPGPGTHTVPEGITVEAVVKRLGLMDFNAFRNKQEAAAIRVPFPGESAAGFVAARGRRTGRTTQMIVKALCHVMNTGEDVLIVAHTAQMASLLAEQAREYARKLGLDPTKIRAWRRGSSVLRSTSLATFEDHDPYDPEGV